MVGKLQQGDIDEKGIVFTLFYTFLRVVDV
jgi:hypothetical protein